MPTLPTEASRRHRARRLLALACLRLLAEREVERLGGFVGDVRPEQQPASWVLDVIAHEEQRAWAA